MPERNLLTGCRVLIVEDDPASARFFSVVLTRSGADVRVAGNAGTALTILETFDPSIVVVDLVLPGLSGLLLARHISESPSTRDIPIIAISIVDGPNTERLARASGCVAYLPKPIEIDTFAASVAAHIKSPV